MSRPVGLWLARGLGVATGTVGMMFFLLASRPDAQPPKLGAMVSVKAASAGAIEVLASEEAIVAAASLRPGDPPARGSVRLRNRSHVAYRVSLKPTASGHRTGLQVSTGPQSVIRPGRVKSIPVSVSFAPGAASLAGETISLRLVPVRERVSGEPD